MAMAKIPIFCRASTLDVLDHALHDEEGVLYSIEQIAYVFIEELGGLVYVDTAKQVHWLKASNKTTVELVDALPSADTADPEVLYIYNNIVYVWDETNKVFKPTFYEVLIQLDTLTTQLNNAEGRIAQLETDFISAEEAISILQGNITSIESNISDINSSITNLQNTKADSSDLVSLQSVVDTKADKTEVNALGIIVETKANATDVAILQNSKADKADTYTKAEVDAMVNVETTSGTVPMVEYINTQSTTAVETANNYTDQQIAIHFV